MTATAQRPPFTRLDDRPGYRLSVNLGEILTPEELAEWMRIESAGKARAEAQLGAKARRAGRERFLRPEEKKTLRRLDAKIRAALPANPAAAERALGRPPRPAVVEPVEARTSAPGQCFSIPLARLADIDVRGAMIRATNHQGDKASTTVRPRNRDDRPPA